MGQRWQAPALNTPQDEPHHRPRARSSRETGFLRQPTRPLPEVVSSSEGASHKRQEFEEGQDAPGLRRAVHIPISILGNMSPKHLLAGMSAKLSTSGPKPRRLSRWATPPGRD